LKRVAASTIKKEAAILCGGFSSARAIIPILVDKAVKHPWFDKCTGYIPL
jgi:hypothetical protein